jgi:hypothetical protein
MAERAAVVIGLGRENGCKRHTKSRERASVIF